MFGSLYPRGTKLDGDFLVIVLNEDEEDERTVRLPVEYEVCGTCRGKGTHVNPAIDSNGLTSEDFADDPDFREEYFSGAYDQECNECHGEKVVPVVDETQADARDLKELREWQSMEAESRAERESELRHGS